MVRKEPGEREDVVEKAEGLAVVGEEALVDLEGTEGAQWVTLHVEGDVDPPEAGDPMEDQVIEVRTVSEGRTEKRVKEQLVEISHGT
mmetsp:Transcript_22649/g.35560  ORF Transcript_22649/g.35560 Transcript_22649/m.35560 type:complete len:87 (-) Transcript_22649:248-508(-)